MMMMMTMMANRFNNTENNRITMPRRISNNKNNNNITINPNNQKYSLFLYPYNFHISILPLIIGLLILFLCLINLCWPYTTAVKNQGTSLSLIRTPVNTERFREVYKITTTNSKHDVAATNGSSIPSTSSTKKERSNNNNSIISSLTLENHNIHENFHQDMTFRPFPSQRNQQHSTTTGRSGVVSPVIILSPRKDDNEQEEKDSVGSILRVITNELVREGRTLRLMGRGSQMSMEPTTNDEIISSSTQDKNSAMPLSFPWKKLRNSDERSSSSSSIAESRRCQDNFQSLRRVIIILGIVCSILSGGTLAKRAIDKAYTWEEQAREDTLAYDIAYTTSTTEIGYGSFGSVWKGDLDKFDV